MTRALSQYLFVLMTVAFVLWGSVLAVSLGRYLRVERNIRFVHWVILGVLLVGGVGLRFFWMPHQFRIFYDGYEIVNLSKKIVDHHSFSQCRGGTLDDCEKKIKPNRPPAFSFLGAVAMKVSGQRTPEVIFTLNSVIGVLCIGMMFFLTMALSGDAVAALLAAFMTSILPLHVMMSTNASTETFNFLLLCSMLFFLRQFMRNNGSLLDFVGLVVAFHLAFFNRSENVLFFFLLPLSSFTFKDKKDQMRVFGYFFHAWVLIIATIIPLLDIFVNIHMIHMAHMDIFYSNKPAGTLIGNLFYMCRNPYLPITIVAPAIGGMVLFWKDASFTAKLIAVHFFVNFITISLVKVGLWIGDFPRIFIAMTVPLFFWAAITISRVSRQCEPRRMLAVFALYMAFFMANLNMNPPAFHKISKYYDRVVREVIPEVPQDCSFFSPNPEMIYLYSNNRAYKIDRLLDEEFMAKHKECKILIRDAFCSSAFKEICERVSWKYSQTILYHNKFPNSYDFIISRVKETRNP